MRVIGVGNVHFHCDSCGLSVQILHDQGFGLLDTFLSQAPDPNVRILFGLGSDFQSRWPDDGRARFLSNL